ncbi:MAG: Stp1/IreP family PP2C-type Ser/Thr phosphatase [Desulfobulbaceae bacterium]|nr:Stp1/IreP family PP2C-type Ser/Thr phosphatase [Desulfobulbaceae bacterium]
MMYFVADGSSDCGRIREHNEDTFLVDSKRGLFIVADGMGGHAGGEIASGLAVETLFKILLGREKEKAEPWNKETLQTAIEQANSTIWQDAQVHPERMEMGTTLTFLCWDRSRFYLGHVGDSRAYRLRGYELTQLTRDHTWVNMQVRAGVLSQQEAEHAQMRHILVKSLGTQPEIEPDIVPVDVEPNDRFLICSDGLSDLVKLNDLRNILASRGTPSQITRRLIEKANAFGGRDNITAVVIDCSDKKWQSKLKSALNKLRR